MSKTSNQQKIETLKAFLVSKGWPKKRKSFRDEEEVQEELKPAVNIGGRFKFTKRA